MIKFVLIRVFAFSLLFFVSIIAITAQINYPAQSTYKYLKGIDAANLSSNWVNGDFNDAGWQTGNAPFRYGDGTGGTELTDMQGNYSTLFLRSNFNVQQAELIEEVSVRADWDDGFMLFINGVQVLSRQAPDVIGYDALSNGLHEYGETEIVKLSATNLNLVEGENTLAVFCCNTSLSESSDFYFDMEFTANVAIPVEPGLPELVDSIGVSFNKVSGFYDSNFTLTITTPVTNAKVVYTLDGSNPQTSSTRIMGNASTQVTINPASTVNRGTTPAVVVRASIIKEGYSASKPELRTFIFLDKVKTQKQPGWDWPTWNVNGQEIDLEMDADVVNSAQYKDKIEEALKDIPSISIATDNANLFDAATGIYVNALNDGIDWERECSVELINPDGTKGFNLNAGLRIRGGWSRHNNYPKHAFRLFFKEEYGDSKLKYPLFEDEGVDHFDKVDLRSEQNYSWANYEGEHNTFIREVFLRDAQGEAGHPYTRSRYYHLYLNGMYWGLFQTQERGEARFASDYLGGNNIDWDVLKQGESGVMATDGNKNKWKEVWDITQTGYTQTKNYYKLEGKDAQGKAMKDSEILVDIDNLIDYMINIFYSGNFDSPVSIWGANNSTNNFYMIKNREDKTLGFQFLIHDAEHTMMTVGTSGPGTIGLYENRVNLAYRDDAKMVNPGFEEFHPQWLHHRLTANEEYRVRFADRAWKHLNGNGIFTEDACVERLNKRADQIEMAVIAESARWGDSHSGEAYTKDNAWLPELNILRNEYFPYRTDIVIDQLLEYDLYPSIAAPIITESGNEIFAEQVFINSATSITFGSASGEIYYTLNGTDPRLIGGDLSADAKKIASGSSVSIPQSAIVKSRVFNNNMWSAIKEINFITKQENYSNFKVTELHYHPLDSIMGADTISDDDYEFIEFKNTSSASAINLSGLVIDSAIYYEFPENTLLAPQQYFVVAAKPKKFFDRYGMVPSGNFSKNFANSGERVLITNSEGTIVMDFIYDDNNPWSESPDGDGPSLVSYLTNPVGDPNLYSYWTYSGHIHGSPFYEDDFSTPVEEIVADNIADAFLVYPNPASDFININYTGTGEGDFTINLYNIGGMLLFSDGYSGKASVSLGSLNVDAGMYFLQIESGNKLVTKKVVYTPF